MFGKVTNPFVSAWFQLPASQHSSKFEMGVWLGVYRWLQIRCMPSGYILFHAIRIHSVSCHPDTICFMPSGYNLFHAIWIQSVSCHLDTFCFMGSGYILFHAIRIQSVSCHPDTICFMPSGYKGNNLLLVVSGHWDWIWIVSEAPYKPYTACILK